VNRGNLAGVKAALNNGAAPNHRSGGPELKRTPLMLAAQLGHLNIVKELLKRGAHVHARDGYGQTALMSALYGNHPNVVRELLVRGAKPGHRSFEQHGSTLGGYGYHPSGVAKRSANALVASAYGRRMLRPVRQQHAQNLLAALFRTTVLPNSLVRYIAKIGRLQKKQNGPRTLGRLTAPR
jgi:hypothetical protein